MAADFLEEFRAVIRSVAEQPFMYPNVGSQVRRALMRRFSYAIYFVVEDEHITVFAVLHQSRSEEQWRRRTRGR